MGGSILRGCLWTVVICYSYIERGGSYHRQSTSDNWYADINGGENSGDERGKDTPYFAEAIHDVSVATPCFLNTISLDKGSLRGYS